MWFKIFVGSLVAFVAGMSTMAAGVFLLPELAHFTIPIGVTIALGGVLAAAVSGIPVMVSDPK